MEVIQEKDARHYDVPGAQCVFYGDCSTGRLSVAVVQQDGRSPTAGWYLNERCTEAFLVLSGSVTFVTPDERRDLGPRDLLYVPPGTRFFLDGKAELAICTEPAWDKSQNRIVES